LCRLIQVQREYSGSEADGWMNIRLVSA
jgi:hypothetical protein